MVTGKSDEKKSTGRTKSNHRLSVDKKSEIDTREIN